MSVAAPLLAQARPQSSHADTRTKMAIELIILSGARQGETHRFTGRSIAFGADPECDLYFDPALDPAANDSLAVLQKGRHGWQLHNYGPEKLIINDRRFAGAAMIRSGDLIRLSPLGPDLHFVLAGAAGDNDSVVINAAGTIVDEAKTQPATPAVRVAPPSRRRRHPVLVITTILAACCVIGWVWRTEAVQLAQRISAELTAGSGGGRTSEVAKIEDLPSEDTAASNVGGKVDGTSNSTTEENADIDSANDGSTTVQNSTVQNSTVQNSTVQNSTVQNSTVQNSTEQSSTQDSNTKESNDADVPVSEDHGLLLERKLISPKPPLAQVDIHPAPKPDAAERMAADLELTALTAMRSEADSLKPKFVETALAKSDPQERLPRPDVAESMLPKRNLSGPPLPELDSPEPLGVPHEVLEASKGLVVICMRPIVTNGADAERSLSPFALGTVIRIDGKPWVVTTGRLVMEISKPGPLEFFVIPVHGSSGQRPLVPLDPTRTSVLDFYVRALEINQPRLGVGSDLGIVGMRGELDGVAGVEVAKKEDTEWTGMETPKLHALKIAELPGRLTSRGAVVNKKPIDLTIERMTFGVSEIRDILTLHANDALREGTPLLNDQGQLVGVCTLTTDSDQWRPSVEQLVSHVDRESFNELDENGRGRKWQQIGTAP